MICIISCLCLQRNCLYTTNIQRCFQRGFHINDTIKVEKYVEFQSNSSFLIVDNCSFECYSKNPKLENLFIEGYSNNVHVKLSNYNSSLYFGDVYILNLSIEFAKYPRKLSARNSLISSSNASNINSFDFDLFTLVNSDLSKGSGKLCLEDYQKFLNIDMDLDLESKSITIENIYSIPNNTNIALSGNSYVFQKDNFSLFLTTVCNEISLLNQTVSIREYMKIGKRLLKIYTDNSTVTFEGKFPQLSFRLEEINTVTFPPVSSLIFNTKNCPDMTILSSYNIIFNTNGIYSFNDVYSNYIQYVSAPKDTIIEIEKAHGIQINISEGSFVRIKGFSIGIYETKPCNIQGSLLLSDLNIPVEASIVATEIVFENWPILNTSNLPFILCSKVSGSLLVDVSSLAIGERKSIINLYDTGNISELNILPLEELEIGEILQWEYSNESVEVWKEDKALDWFVCISDNSSICQKNSLKFDSIENFTENFNINDYDEIYIEAFYDETVNIDVKHKMNVSLAYGSFRIRGDELIDTLRIYESIIEKEDDSNISCRAFYVRNSEISKVVISPTVDFHLIMPCKFDLRQYSGSPTVHVENGNTEISFLRNYLDTILNINAFDSVLTIEPSKTHLVVENIIGEINMYGIILNTTIIDCNINFIMTLNAIDEKITIINSNVNFISKDNEVNEVIFRDPTKIIKTNVTTNFPMMVVNEDLSLNHTTFNYKDGFVSFDGKVRLFDEKVDYKHFRFKDLVIGIDNFVDKFYIVDRLFLESSPSLILISTVEFATNKRPEILLNLTLSQPTLIRILSSKTNYIPPRIRINNLIIDKEYILGVKVPIICANRGNVTDFDIVFPVLENFSIKTSISNDYNRQCVMVSVDENNIIEEDADLYSISWTALASIFLTISIILIAIFICAIKRSKKKSKNLYEMI